jgi:hypothetical protein
MSKPTLSRSAPAAIPILMRLPDLRVAKSAGDACGTEAAPAHAVAVCDAVAPQADAPAEADARSEPPTTLVQTPEIETAASCDIANVDAAAADVRSEPPAGEAAATLPENSQPDAAVHDEPAANAGAADTLLVDLPAPADPPAPVASARKADVTNASPPATAAPVAPAVARRQRALERQRRQVAEPARQRTWWTTHAPVIAIGFLAALVLTIAVGRLNRARPSSDHQAEMELPELEIDIGTGSDSLSPSVSEPEMLAVDPPAEATVAADDVKPAVKSPPLLSAKPKAAVPDEVVSLESPRTAAKPGSDESHIANPYVSTSVAESVPAAAELASEPMNDYPSTEPAVYRPGGRVPREARAPNYPQTSTPHLR